MDNTKGNTDLGDIVTFLREDTTAKTTIASTAAQVHAIAAVAATDSDSDNPTNAANGGRRVEVTAARELEVVEA